jgi:DNA-binding transcriptional LysR family regulator
LPGSIPAYASELAEKVSAHEIDLAIISRRPGTFTWQKLFEDPLTAWVPADDPRKVYPLKDLKKDNYIEFFAGSESDNSLILARHHIVPNIRYSAMSPSTAFAMVSAGLGVTLINHLYTGFFQGHVRELPIEPAVQMEIGIASIPREELSPAAAVFLNTLQKNL